MTDRLRVTNGIERGYAQGFALLVHRPYAIPALRAATPCGNGGERAGKRWALLVEAVMFIEVDAIGEIVLFVVEVGVFASGQMTVAGA